MSLAALCLALDWIYGVLGREQTAHVFEYAREPRGGILDASDRIGQGERDQAVASVHAPTLAPAQARGNGNDLRAR